MALKLEAWPKGTMLAVLVIDFWGLYAILFIKAPFYTRRSFKYESCLRVGDEMTSVLI